MLPSTQSHNKRSTTQVLPHRVGTCVPAKHTHRLFNWAMCISDSFAVKQSILNRLLQVCRPRRSMCRLLNVLKGTANLSHCTRCVSNTSKTVVQSVEPCLPLDIAQNLPKFWLGGCRVEVLGAGINGQLLSGTTAVPGALHVHLWPVLDWLPFLHLQLMRCYSTVASSSEVWLERSGRRVGGQSELEWAAVL